MNRFVLMLLLASCSLTSAVRDAGASAPQKLALEPLLAATPDGGSVRLSQEDDQYFKITPLPPVGPPVPGDLVMVHVDGEHHDWDSAAKRLLIVATEETYLAQLSALFAKLDDGGADVWLKHPEANIAFGVALRDERAFQAWIDEPVPGKLRVIHRADGFELQTNLGKLHGPDPRGPTVPVRGGKLDLMTMQRGLQKISGRFPGAPDICFVPSFGMELNQTIRAMAGNYVNATTAYYPQTCLVYPRPRARDAGQ